MCRGGGGGWGGLGGGRGRWVGRVRGGEGREGKGNQWGGCRVWLSGI